MSSAPHLHNASTRTDLTDWGAQPDMIAGTSHSSGLLVHKGPDNRPESGTSVCTPGTWRLSLPGDELCCFVQGRATYTHDDGEVAEVTPQTLVMFPTGCSGTCTVHETLRNTYILF